MIARAAAPSWEPFRPIGSVMDDMVPHVAPGMPAAEVSDVLAREGSSRALVVDGDGRPLGVVSRSRLSAAGTAATSMRPLTLVLHTSVPISVAAALIASSDSGAIAVVSDERLAVGILTWRELAAWVAREAGHRLPGGIES